MTEPVLRSVPEPLRKHGWTVVALLAAGSLVVVVSAGWWGKAAAEHWLPLRVMLASVLMVPAGLLALVLMPPDRAAGSWNRATPGLFRAWVAMWIGELAIFGVVLLLYVWPDMRDAVRLLPDWVVSGISVLVLFAFLTWFAFGSVLVVEMWHRARARIRRLSGRA